MHPVGWVLHIGWMLLMLAGCRGRSWDWGLHCLTGGSSFVQYRGVGWVLWRAWEGRRHCRVRLLEGLVVMVAR